jgi:hypothetical protein
MNAERVQEMITELQQRMQQTPLPCYVCEVETSDGAGVWMPTPAYSKALGAPPGKTRLLAYPICNSCASKKGKQGEWVTAFIEAKAIARHRGEPIVYMGADGMPLCPLEHP